MCQDHQHVVIRVLQRPVRLAGRFEDSLDSRIRGRDAKDDRVSRASRRDEPRLVSGSHLSQSHSTQVQDLADVLLEGSPEVVVRGVARECGPKGFQYPAQTRDVAVGPWAGAAAFLPDGIRLIHKDLHERLTKCNAMTGNEQ